MEQRNLIQLKIDRNSMTSDLATELIERQLGFESTSHDIVIAAVHP